MTDVKLNPAAMTKEQAGLHFRDKVREAQEQQGVDLVTAWAMTRALAPELFARAFAEGDPAEPAKVRLVGSFSSSAQILAPPATVQLAASPAGSGRKRSLFAVPNEGNIESLGLPRDCNYEEFRAADLANAGATPRNTAAIFEALVGLQVQRGISLDAARDVARERYPQLFLELNHGVCAVANGDPQDASRRAHAASADAAGKQGHVAAAAHETAAQAQSKAGDTEAAEMHRRMSSYHTGQANRFKKT